MTCIIPLLAEYKIPTKSVGDAVRFITKTFANHYNTKNKIGFEDMVEKLTGQVYKAKHAKEAEMMFGYVVQVAVSIHVAGFIATGPQVLMEAEQKVAAYFAKNPWAEAASETAPIEVIDGVITPASTAQSTGRGKRSGPSKKDQCIALFNKDGNKDKARKELIEIFVKELGLTPAGASTYVHNCQKAIWK